MTLDKIKILSYNIQGKVTKRETQSIVKISVLLRYMKENKYDIACIQETKASQGEVYESALRYCPHVQVIECSNLDNKRKGGVAVICINDKIKLTKVLLDNELTSNWSESVATTDQHQYESDSVTGKFMQVCFDFNDQMHQLVNVYAPSKNEFCRHKFYRFMGTKIISDDRLTRCY